MGTTWFIEKKFILCTEYIYGARMLFILKGGSFLEKH
jgi:hypothetical protein